MRIKAVLWDFGGVLMRTEDWEPRRRLAQKFELTREELEDLLWHNEMADKAARGEISADQQWAYFLKQLGISFDQKASILEQFFAGDHLDTELVDFIRGLKGPYLTGLISNAFDDMRPFIENELKIGDAFHQIVISAEEGVMKPAEEIYRTALEELHIYPKEAIFVDDFIENVIGAREIGMHAIHFANRDKAWMAVRELLRTSDEPQT